MLIYCQCTFGEREKQTEFCFERVEPYVDRCIIIHDGTLSNKFIKWASNKGIEMHEYPWTDNFSEYRNHYFELAEIGDWVLFSDPDEIFDWITCKELKNFIEQCESIGADSVQFNAVDIMVKSLDKVNVSVDVNRATDWYKTLMIKKNKETRFIGTPHESLLGQRKFIKTPRSACYYHIKTPLDVIERGTRNFHVNGGGPNLGTKNPHWVKYKKLLSELKIDVKWPEMRTILREGNVPIELKEFIIGLRDVDGFDGCSEIRQYYFFYFMHNPSELPKNIRSKYSPL